MRLFQVTMIALGLISTVSHANTAPPLPQVKHLTGAEYDDLRAAVQDLNELNAIDRLELKTEAANRALGRVRAALNRLAARPGGSGVPLDPKAPSLDLARDINRIHLAAATIGCDNPVVAFYIFNPTASLKILQFSAGEAIPSLESVRVDNPGCTVKKVPFSFSPAVR